MSETVPQTPVFSFANIGRGDPAAPLSPCCPGLQNALDHAAGRYVAACFYLSGDYPAGRTALAMLPRLNGRFGAGATFAAVGVKGAGEAEHALRAAAPEVVFVNDWDRAASRAFGAMPREALDRSQGAPARPRWIVFDPSQHVLAVFPCTPEGGEEAQIAAFLAALPPPERFSPIELPPPILILPNVFEEALCRRLIDTYERDGGRETGVVINASTEIDHRRKRRRDCTLQEKELIEATHRRLASCIAPEIKRLFFMDIRRVDRNIVACYAAEDEAHFMMPHRDNNAPTTAYRRFAVSINLNEDFEGGAVRFPEYGPRDYKAPPGWAVVFPCAILHQVTPVTKGRRYVFLPFVFD